MKKNIYVFLKIELFKAKKAKSIKMSLNLSK